LKATVAGTLVGWRGLNGRGPARPLPGGGVLLLLLLLLLLLPAGWLMLRPGLFW
jgi:hypothetical protein